MAARFDAAVSAVPEEEREQVERWLEGRYELLEESETEQEPTEEELKAAATARVDRILAAHPEALTALSEILRVPSSVMLASLDVADETLPHLVASRSRAAQWGLAALRRSIARGDASTAMRLVQEIATLGADLERAGATLAWVSGSNTQRVAIGFLGPVFDLHVASVDELRALAHMLDVLDASRRPFAETVEVGRATARRALSLEWWPEDEGLRDTGWRHLWSARIYRAAALDELDPAMDRLGQIAGADDVGSARSIAAARSVTDGVENHVLRMFVVMGPVCLRVDAQAESARRVARAAVAVALHVAETGEAPASLDALVPTYLPRVPLDPWDGKPLRYAIGPAKVWSIGRDGRDDGGTPYEDPEDDGGPGDVVVTIRGR